MKTSLRRQSGIALLTALILVAIATVVATAIGFSGALAARRSVTQFSADQALLGAQGAEAMAAYLLSQSNSQSWSLDQDWAQPYGPLALAPGVMLDFAQIEDQQGKFNLNSLVKEQGSQLVVDPMAVKLFENLLAGVGLETKWAGQMADWIDSDSRPQPNDGAEDSAYLALPVPYRTANTEVTSISEIMALPGFGRARYERLAPYIAALPHTVIQINTCTASGVLLDALSGQTEYGLDTQSLATHRQKNGCFPTTADFGSSLTSSPITDAQARRITTTSKYFRLRSFITMGGAHFAVYSSLMLNGNKVRPYLRTFGTE